MSAAEAEVLHDALEGLPVGGYLVDDRRQCLAVLVALVVAVDPACQLEAGGGAGVVVLEVDAHELLVHVGERTRYARRVRCPDG